MPPVEFMTWREVDALLASDHEVGSHTVNHARISALSRERMQDEIGRSRTMIEEKAGPIRHFSWPFGGFEHFHADAVRMVFEAGYRSCASAVRGCHVAAAPEPSRLCLRRENTLTSWPLSHIDYFLARSAIVAGESDNDWPAAWAGSASEAQACASRS